jgi:hypothetical protein
MPETGLCERWRAGSAIGAFVLRPGCRAQPPAREGGGEVVVTKPGHIKRLRLARLEILE